MSYVLLLVRKPLSEKNIAKNLQRWGCGAIHIDACRIQADKRYAEKCESVVGLDSNRNGICYGEMTGLRENSWSPNGRWPANLILLHEKSCSIIDTEEQSWSINRWDEGAKPFGGGAGTPFTSEEVTSSQEIWSCSCPLETPPHTQSWHGYFKQVSSTEDLWAYLHLMINPPDGNILVSDIPIEADPDTFHGALVRLGHEGDVETFRRYFNILRPGAHMIVEGDPMGFVGAPLMDAGFEIRDTLYIITDTNDGYYVPKAKPKEREKLAVVQKKQRFEWMEESPTSKEEKENDHRSVKPLGVIESLLKDVPKSSKVFEPFLGSGTTAVACLRNGIDCTGVEKYPKYAKISYRRVHGEIDHAPLRYMKANVRLKRHLLLRVIITDGQEDS